MYCVKCGVQLGDTEQFCPLCATRCYHPDIPRSPSAPLYPTNRQPQRQYNSTGIMSAVTVLFLIPLLISLLCDLRINSTVTWSGYVMGALLLMYEIFLLPCWFRKPNPVIFVPCGFAAVALFLLYINFHVDGNWFMPFAFPLVGCLCLLFTTLITLLRYVHRGKLYIFGSCILTLGVFMPCLEYQIMHIFHRAFKAWSIYPFVALILLGSYLIFLGICKPVRESMQRKFFI